MPVLEREQQKTKTSRDFAVSVVLHLIVIGVVIGSGLIFKHKGESWGDQSLQASSISATAVSAIPLPPKQPPKEENVLASEQPSPAPVENKEKTEEAPSPKDLLIQKKPEKTKVAEKPQQAVQKPQVTKPQPDKATTGEAGGVRIAMSAVQTRNGTVGIAVSDNAFGARFAYYVTQMKQKIAQQWYMGSLPPGARGRRVYYSFRIERDGSPSQVQLTKTSGDSSLDTSAVRALQRIETFGPLPDGYTGRYLDVQFYFEPPQ